MLKNNILKLNIIIFVIIVVIVSSILMYTTHLPPITPISAPTPTPLPKPLPTGRINSVRFKLLNNERNTNDG